MKFFTEAQRLDPPHFVAAAMAEDVLVLVLELVLSIIVTKCPFKWETIILRTLVLLGPSCSAVILPKL